MARRAFDGDVGAAAAPTWARRTAEARWVALDPGRARRRALAAGRVPRRRTGPRFIEINSDAPAGFGYGDRMAEVFAAPARSSARSPRAAAVALPRPRRRALVEAVRAVWRRAAAPRRWSPSWTGRT